MRWAYPLVLLGGLVVIAVTQGSDQIRQDAVSRQAESVVSGDPAAVGEGSIRLVDFGEIDQSPEVCAEGLGNGAVSSIGVSQGRSGVIDELRHTRLAVDSDPPFGDITGDGIENAVVHVVCSYGANGTQHTLQVWDVTTGEARIAATITEPPAEVTGPLAPDVRSYTVRQGAVEIVWTSYTESDPNCCPSLETRIRYRVVGGDVVQLGEPETTPASAEG